MSTDDLDEMASLLGDPRVMEHYPHPKDRAETAEWIDRNQRRSATDGFGLWIIETHDGEFLGDCGLTWQKLHSSIELEVGYHVKTSAQNLGFATEAAAACRDFAGTHALASCLVSIIHRDNRPSKRVAAKIGMDLDHTLRHSSPVHLVYAIDL
ncbi:GNAT family N-acetyltransferase [Brevibacterium antiquum]